MRKIYSRTILSMGTHDSNYESYENPPDKPFFGKLRKKTLSTATQAVVSPSKGLSMRSECIDQMDK